MRVIADLHIHSHFSRATSPKLTPPYLDRWAQIKGLQLVGTGDCTHPLWLKTLREHLDDAEEGLYTLKAGIRRDFEVGPGVSEGLPCPPGAGVPRFVLTGEISTIYKKEGKTRKVHHLVILSGFTAAAAFQTALERVGNIRSDGRPILGMDSRDLFALLLDADPKALLIPAHIWTPWFSALGAQSGFDSLAACYEDLTPYIAAVETGLSSNPPMNWALTSLDPFSIISNSDAHAPEKLGREGTVFAMDMGLSSLSAALRRDHGDAGVLETIEFFPQEGKYHYDGHRKCAVYLTPEAAAAASGMCPVCHKPLTRGVMGRVLELADSPVDEWAPCPAEYARTNRRPYRSLIPLKELLGELLEVGSASKKVEAAYRSLIGQGGSELSLLMDTPQEVLAGLGAPGLSGEQLALAIQGMRRGAVSIQPGYDGEYGVIRAFPPGQAASHELPGIETIRGALPLRMDRRFPDDPSRGLPEGEPGAVPGPQRRRGKALPGNRVSPAGAKPQGGIPRPSEGFSQPSESFSQPSEACSRPLGDFFQPTGDFSQSSEDFFQPSEDFFQPSEDFFQPSEEHSQSSEEHSQSSEEHSQPLEEVSQPLEDFSQSSEERSQPSEGFPQPEQEQVITYEGRYALIIAGPGSGKTATLSARIARLIRQGASAETIVALTFTVKAAWDLRERILRMIGAEAGRARITVGTFHSLCAAILREQGESRGRGAFRILTEGERDALLQDLCAESPSPVRPRSLGTYIETRKRFLLLPGEERPNRAGIPFFLDDREAFPVPPAQPELEEGYRRYQERLHAAAALDFEDLLIETIGLLARGPGQASSAQRGFRHIFVDEYQDINLAQYVLIRSLAAERYGASLWVIGDPHQGIYRFRGSDSRFIDRFRYDYPKAARFHLSRSFRCAEPISTAAGRLMHTPLRGVPGEARLFRTPYPTEKAEAQGIARRIGRLIGGTTFFALDSGAAGGGEPELRSLGDCAILLRTLALAAPITKALGDQGIPFILNGEKPWWEQEPIGSLLGMLRNPGGIAGENPSPAEAVKRAWEAVPKKPKGKQAAAQKELVERLIGIAGWYGTLPAFLDTLAVRDASGRDDANGMEPGREGVQIMSIHASKGLEFDHVFVPALEDGLLPFTLYAGKEGTPQRIARIEEEKRLLYVAMTRARVGLYLSFARKRTFQGRKLEQRGSPFLDALETLIPLYEEPSRRPRDFQLPLF